MAKEFWMSIFHVKGLPYCWNPCDTNPSHFFYIQTLMKYPLYYCPWRNNLYFLCKSPLLHYKFHLLLHKRKISWCYCWNKIHLSKGSYSGSIRCWMHSNPSGGWCWICNSCWLHENSFPVILRLLGRPLYQRTSLFVATTCGRNGPRGKSYTQINFKLLKTQL